MQKKINKIISVVLAMIVSLSIFQSNLITTKAQTTNKVDYNVASTQIPYIYCFSYQNKTVTLKEGVKKLPENIYYMIAYIKTDNFDVNESQSEVTVNGETTNVTWNYAENGKYKTASFYVNSNGTNDVNINLVYASKRNFAIRARKIFHGSGNQNAMESELNANPAKYLLYDSAKKVLFEGEINTGISSYTNFIHWKQIKGESQHIGSDDTYVKNLPNGEYTLIETNAGGNLTTINQSSTSVWLNTSFMKESNQGKYYNFQINDSLIDTWMNACIIEQQSNSLFFGFYTQNMNTTYNVMYDGNGYNQGSMAHHTKKSKGEIVPLNKNEFVKWGYVFTGWNTLANPTATNPGESYADEASFTVKGEDTVLYAQWKLNINVYHDVYIKDHTKEDVKLIKADSKVVDHTALAYDEEGLQTIADTYVKEGYQYRSYEIEFKTGNSDEWLPYEETTILSNKDQVRYILNIDKEESNTKQLSYHVEHWIDEEDIARDSVEYKENVWINDERITLTLQEIELKSYEGYEFSHYEPTTLPETVENGTVIKVVYSKVKAPIEPENPSIPEIPVTPEKPTEPLTPIIPIPPVQPTPITPTEPNPITPIQPTPIAPVQPTPTVIQPQETPAVAPENEPVVNENNTIVEGTEETEEVKENETPLAPNKSMAEGSWALINLLCALGAILLSLLAILLKKTKEEECEKELNSSKNTIVYERRSWTKIVTILIAISSVILFLVTEDMTLKIAMIDKWTILMAIVLLVQIIVYISSRRWNEKKDTEPTTKA